MDMIFSDSPATGRKEVKVAIQPLVHGVRVSPIDVVGKVDRLLAFERRLVDFGQSE